MVDLGQHAMHVCIFYGDPLQPASKLEPFLKSSMALAARLGIHEIAFGNGPGGSEHVFNNREERWSQ